MRGFQIMIAALKTQYVAFLTQNELISLLVEKAKSVASQSSTPGLLSVAQLQQLADGMRKENMDVAAELRQQEEAKADGGRP